MKNKPTYQCCKKCGKFTKETLELANKFSSDPLNCDYCKCDEDEFIDEVER